MTVYSTLVTIPAEVDIEVWMETYGQTREEALDDINSRLAGEARDHLNTWLGLNGFGHVPGEAAKSEAPAVWVAAIEWGSDYQDIDPGIHAGMTEDAAWLAAVADVWAFYHNVSEPPEYMSQYVAEAGEPDLTDPAAARAWYDAWHEIMTEAWVTVEPKTLKAA